MAATTTYDVGAAGGNREGLSDTITRLKPTSIELYNRLGKESVSVTKPEWPEDVLAAAAQNAAIEGGDFVEDTLVAPTRNFNYLQINKKQIKVSRTQDKVAQAGRRSYFQFQKVKKTEEMMRDIEYTLMQGAQAVGSNSAARGCLGVVPFITTNVYANGGTLRNITLGLVNTAIQGAYDQGGDPTIMYLNSGLAAPFANLTTGAGDFRRVENDPTKVVNATKMYVSPYGVQLEIRIHRHMPANTVVFLDENFWEVGVFDAPFSEPLAKTGDSVRGQTVTEYTLLAHSQRSSAALKDVQ